MKKILITGSSGYIGSCLEKFLKGKFNIYLIDKVKPKRKSKNFYLCDLRKKEKIKKIFQKIKPETVIHLAGESTIDNIKNKNKYIENNYTATKNIVNVCAKSVGTAFIFASTAAVYSSSKDKISENSKINLNNIYALTKYNCEKYIIKKFNKKNFIILRFFNVCSSIFNLRVGELHNPETHLIPIIVNKFLNNKVIKIYSNNKNTTNIRDYIHIYDLCNAIKKSIYFLKKKSHGYVFNLGGGQAFSTQEIIEYFNKKFSKRKLKYIYFKKRFGDKKKLVCSNVKIKKILKWYPKKSNLKKIFSHEIEWQKYLMQKKIKRKTIY